jgi:hypothetical protein
MRFFDPTLNSMAIVMRRVDLNSRAICNALNAGNDCGRYL